MAQKVVVNLVSDISGVPADETVTLALDGRGFEIDLTSAEAADLRSVLAPYVSAGRRTGAAPARTGRARRTGSGSGPSADEVRVWLRAQGHEVGDRGRIKKDLRDLYDAAH
ncbi:MAG: Lsr2 family protein [Cellulomonas sp.]|uniref:histone-like nucleoid-structuring protein Lsr2 n=1 Tax=Cellulomonas sp. TaxID=40001 RepID=UPI0025870614|nr:Lsr2 family protein [Cellulomonas sp.]MCR6706204.1 Lsr2 family protein [Cellulomonas sp.]